MPRGRRHAGYEAEGPARKPRMQLVEVSKAVVFLVDETKATMTLAATAELTRQAQQLRGSKKKLSRTQERLATSTRAFDEKEAEAERAEPARRLVSVPQERSRRELAAAAAALREKDEIIEGLLARVGEAEAEARRAERHREEAAARLESLRQEFAAANAGLRERDATIESLLASARENAVAAERMERARVQLAGSLESSQQELTAAAAALREKDEHIEGLLSQLGRKEAEAAGAEALAQAAERLERSRLRQCALLPLLSGAGHLPQDAQSVTAAAEQSRELVEEEVPPRGGAGARGSRDAPQEICPPKRKISAALRLMWMARSPEQVTASFAFNVDTIGIRLAEWAPAAWAPVRRGAAQHVLKVYGHRVRCWQMSSHCSYGMLADDRQVAGGRVAEVGELRSARLAFERLKAEVLETTGGRGAGVSQFIRRIDMVLCIVEQYRLEWLDLNWATNLTGNRLRRTHNAILYTLEPGMRPANAAGT